MSTMKKIAFQVGLMAVLALLGTVAASAQDFPKVNSPYHCNWERYNSSGQLLGKGVSLVTFKDVTYPQFYIQDGTLFTVYADASSISRDYQVHLHVVNGGLYFYQDNPAISCVLTTSNGGNTVVWSGCSNYVKQWCYQP